MQTIYLIRGLPGSGKSTFARGLLCDLEAQNDRAVEWVEADDYFMRMGVYCYDPNFVRQAHEVCQQRAQAALESGKDVIVSNTFVRRWEMQPYIKMAESCGALVTEITMTGEFDSVHRVPSKKVEEMASRWEE